MNFPHEVPLSSAHPIILRHREVERSPKMPWMRELSFLHPVFQSAEGRRIAQSAEQFQFFCSDVIVFLEMLRQDAVYLDVAEFHRTMRVLGAHELGGAQFLQQFLVSLIYHPLELDAFGTDFMPVADGWRLGTDTESTDAVLDAFSNRGSERNDK